MFKTKYFFFLLSSQMANIPAAVPLANLPANILRPAAGPMAANVTPTAMDCVQETMYLKDIKTLRSARGAAIVTDAKLGEAIIPHHKIVSKAAGAGAAPAWAAQILQNQAQMQQNLAEMIQLMQVFQRNIRIRDRNRTVGMQSQMSVPLKEIIGHPAVPVLQPPNWVQPNFQNAPAVGDTPQQHGIMFPQTGNDLLGLTRSQIASLAFFYNDDFMILPQDPAAIWVSKFGGYVGLMQQQ
jgi:hypothetical protein